jgi:hypothetical protein
VDFGYTLKPSSVKTSSKMPGIWLEQLFKAAAIATSAIVEHFALVE